MAHHPVRGEFGEGDLGDQLRLHPMGAPRLGARHLDRRRLRLDPGQPLGQILQRRHAEAGADLAGVAQLAALVDREQQRSQRPALAVARRPAGDDDQGAAGLRDLVVLLKPVRRPLPHVARHLVEPIAVRRERTHGRRAVESVRLHVLPRELALPGVAHRLPVGRVVVSPGVLRAFEPAARRELPLGFRRQLLAGPLRVCLDVLPGHVHDGMLRHALEVAVRPLRTPPVRALHVRPPVVRIAQVHRAGGPTKDHRRGLEHLRLRAGIVVGVRGTLGERDVVRGVDEATELGVRHRVRIHPEAADRDLGGTGASSG